MTTTLKIVKYELSDVVRSRWLLAYALFFGVATDALLRFSGSDAKALLSVMNLVLFIVPLVSVVFGTIFLYNAREFTELLLAQPVNRRQLFVGLYLGLTLPLAASIVAGIAIPFAIHGVTEPSTRGTIALMLLAGVALTAIFTALAFLIATHFEDRVKGLGLSIALWLGFAVLYDGLVLLVAMLFADYALERPMLGLMLANPVDLARVALLMRFDLAAMMGYTGAVFQRALGQGGGLVVAGAALLAWLALPVTLSLRRFQRKDF